MCVAARSSIFSRCCWRAGISASCRRCGRRRRQCCGRDISSSRPTTATISPGRTRVLNLLLFMVVAVVTSHLANSMKQQTELAPAAREGRPAISTPSRAGWRRPPRRRISISRSRSTSPISSSARLVLSAAAPAASTSSPIRRRCRNACAPPWRRRRRAARRRPRSTTATADVWLVRRVSERTADFGVIAIDLGSVPAGAVDDEIRHRVDDVLLPMRAATLEHLDVARAPQRREDALRGPSCCGKL